MKTWLDEGPKDWIAGAYDVTRQDTCQIELAKIAHLPGECNEHELFARCRTGRMSIEQWEAFKTDLSKNGMRDAIFVIKEKNGQVHISEGNHRMRAALALGWKMVPVEIRYFGNSQQEGLVV